MADFAEKSERIHSVQQLLKAYTLFEKDVEYVVMEGLVKIVDEQTVSDIIPEILKTHKEHAKDYDLIAQYFVGHNERQTLKNNL